MTPRRAFNPFEVLRRLQRNLRQAEHLYMVLIALGIGLLGGLAAVGFRKLIEVGNQVAWGEGQYTLDYIRSLPWWQKVATPCVGGLIVGMIVHHFAREAKGHGVPEVMEAVALNQGRIRPRVVAAKLLASGICIASGGSVGREGPIVQIGSTLGSTIGQWLRIDPRRLRTLVGCGAAAGIAGTFNAPVAGAMFAVEIILADFAVGQFSPIVISSVAATVVSRHFLGDFPAFEVPAYSLEHAGELMAYGVLGLLAGLAALAFIKILYGCEDLFERIRVYPPLKTAAGGALIGLIALKLPEIYGVGYEAINGALRNEMVWHSMLILVAAKIVAVSITIGSGGSGGIFAPSLFIGAMLGGAIGTVVHSIWPESTASAGAYALVGMGAIVAAGTHAPITAILIIFELTGDYKIILPLMISCIIATLVSTGFQKGSIYTLKLLRRGIDIRHGQQLDVLKHVKVSEVMRPDFIVAGPSEDLMAILAKFRAGSHASLFVVEGDDLLLGIVTIYDIRPIIDEAPMVASLLVASDLMAKHNIALVSPDDTLDKAIMNLGQYRGEMPVVKGGRLVGAIWPEDVIKRYNTEVFERDMAQSVVMSIGDGFGPVPVPGANDLSLATIEVPGGLVGETLSQSEVRGRFGITVVLIKQKSDGVEKPMNAVPGPDYIFREGDQMLVIGPDEGISRLHQMV